MVMKYNREMPILIPNCKGFLIITKEQNLHGRTSHITVVTIKKHAFVKGHYSVLLSIKFGLKVFTFTPCVRLKHTPFIVEKMSLGNSTFSIM
jgi:hypothetical protein